VEECVDREGQRVCRKLNNKLRIDQEGKLVTNKEEIKRRWTAYNEV